MRTIHCKDISRTVASLCMEANYYLPTDVQKALEAGRRKELSPVGRSILEDIEENYRYAGAQSIPICQDTGMAVIFCELGQEVHIEGGALEDAVNEGVRRGYLDGYLRSSVVADPLRRENTGDNTPAVLHLRLVEGDSLRITAAPKGFGSENMSALKMFTPAASAEDIETYIVETVSAAGSNPCPPIILGVGLGGTAEKAALLAKTALLRSPLEDNPDPFYAEMEHRLLEKINRLGIGPQGLGGTLTALGVNIETYPTHIAGLPCSINIGCHVTRHASAVL
ncbi:fumarate hydratase [Papillibacter cinnamivorans]|uniref:Fumarate hydratase subunit alpha n=1 Tax=Papillibacter cinnamivorans DSM 12816 TaxID=1122930 RepID=A0A1W2A2Z1_9FIRM|nr:fumarate hydratase [Papillibacter cinnamivorans]SMC55034.1 fumarate hydratase subunit alpha [Papillibacter cinnamivorans DSM 12816]